MASMFDWTVKFKCKEGVDEKVTALEKHLKGVSYNGGATSIDGYAKDYLNMDVSSLNSSDYREGDCHWLGMLGVLALPEEYWNEACGVVWRQFMNGADFRKGYLEIYFYGPESCDELFTMLVEKSGLFESYEVSGGEDFDEDEEYEDEDDEEDDGEDEGDDEDEDDE